MLEVRLSYPLNSLPKEDAQVIYTIISLLLVLPPAGNPRRRFRQVAEDNGERLLESGGNTISFAITLDTLIEEVRGNPSPPLKVFDDS